MTARLYTWREMDTILAAILDPDERERMRKKNRMAFGGCTDACAMNEEGNVLRCPRHADFTIHEEPG